MRHVAITCQQREAMLRAVGLSDADELFADIPSEVRLREPLDLPAGVSEIELMVRARELANKNLPAGSLVSFAGAGCYDHYVPTVVERVLARPEFFTAYTPYQPEVSQGTLQAMWEYQTMICELTGMEVSNASMYDGATAAVEAALMACRVTKRLRVVVSGALHPEWIGVFETYSQSGLFDLVVLDAVDGATLLEDVKKVADEFVACVVVASPNFVGNLEDLTCIGDVAHECGSLFVVASNPVLLGVLEQPAAQGADIVVGEGQPLGNHMSFGGPGFGFFACRMEHVRQMPGRIVGRGQDVDGSDAYVLTLSTREQHIRREKATSNICSNHALNALAAGAYLSAVGSRGLSGIATACVAKAHYMREQLIATSKFASPWPHPFGHEFALLYDGDADHMHREMLKKGIFAGVILSYASEEDSRDLILFAVTEKRTRAQIDAFVSEVAAL